jgi:nitrate reductase molybdenum cofactor assembly chaperone
MMDLPIVQATYDERPVSEKERSFGTLARLLSYPDNHYLELVELLYLIVQNQFPDAARGVSEFGQFAEQCGEYELEEAYTRTFDVNPSCALEIGWHLFGEDYMRGQFLVRMRGELARYEIPESSELPDHLAHVLAVLAAMPDDVARQFSHACVFPAIYKMQAALEKNGSPYRRLIHCLVAVLEHHFGASEPWDENDDKLLRNTKGFPGQNGPRPAGLGDPLRSFPMPGARDEATLKLVPLQMQYGSPPVARPAISDADNGSTT